MWNLFFWRNPNFFSLQKITYAFFQKVFRKNFSQKIGYNFDVLLANIKTYQEKREFFIAFIDEKDILILSSHLTNILIERKVPLK